MVALLPLRVTPQKGYHRDMENNTSLADDVNDVPPPRLTRLSNLLGQWDADADARHEAKQSGHALGPVVGLPSLDAALGGALQTGLHIVHGVPGVGKTAFALHVAVSCGCPVLYLTAEMSSLELLRRITARATETFLGKLKSGEIEPDKSKELVRRAVRQARRLALLDATQSPILPSMLLDLADAARAIDPASPHLLIIVDSLHSWAEGLPGEMPEYEALNASLRSLRQIAARLGCPVLAIAERNRASMKDGGLSAGAGSRKIEYGAESVIDLDTEKDAREDGNGEKAVNCRVSKNRNGASGRELRLKFHGALQRYTEA